MTVCMYDIMSDCMYDIMSDCMHDSMIGMVMGCMMGSKVMPTSTWHHICWCTMQTLLFTTELCLWKRNKFKNRGVIRFTCQV